MAELTTDAQALSEASTNFDGIRSFFLFEDRSSESGAGMQDTEKGVTGMFASAGDEGGQAVQKLASIWGGSGSEAYQSTQQRWDSTAADDAASSLGSAMGFTPPDDGLDFKAMETSEVASDSLKYNFGGIEGAADGAKGGNVEFEWKVEEGESSVDVFDLKAMEAGESASLKYNFGGIDGAASAVQGTADVFDLKAMETGEAASDSLKYNFGGIDGAAGAVHRSFDGDDLATYQPDTHDGGAGGLLFGSGGDGGIPATLAEWALLLA